MTPAEKAEMVRLGPGQITPLVVRADARCLPLPDASVDLIVTSPPYFGLRSYQDGGEHYAGQVGDEATPQEFLEALWACTREWVRVLKPDGNLWVNLGDKYGGNGHGPQGDSGARADRAQVITYADRRPPAVGRPKSLLGIPWRYALGCIDTLGLILRAEVVWSKPNGLPESVTDRVRRSHEQWFHFVRQPRYFSAVDEVREAHQSFAGFQGHAKKYGEQRNDDGRSRVPMLNPALGKLPGSVWTVPTEPLKVPDHLGVDHFAAFPTEFPRRIIAGWSPSGVCVECGQGRRPVAGHAPWWEQYKRENGLGDYMAERRDVQAQGARLAQTSVRIPEGGKHVITGYACACPEPTAATTPSVVLDPFGGTGTTALVASALGRIGISVDLSHDYSRLARWRTTDPGERAKALRIDKPPVQNDGQIDLFGGAA